VAEVLEATVAVREPALTRSANDFAIGSSASPSSFESLVLFVGFLPAVGIAGGLIVVAFFSSSLGVGFAV
jgi:hypothetical protein